MKWKTSDSVSFYTLTGGELIRIDSKGFKVNGAYTEDASVIIDKFSEWFMSALGSLPKPRTPKKSNWIDNLKENLSPVFKKQIEVSVDYIDVVIFKYNGDIVLKNKVIGSSCLLYDGFLKVLNRNK